MKSFAGYAFLGVMLFAAFTGRESLVVFYLVLACFSFIMARLDQLESKLNGNVS